MYGNARSENLDAFEGFVATSVDLEAGSRISDPGTRRHSVINYYRCEKKIDVPWSNYVQKREI